MTDKQGNTTRNDGGSAFPKYVGGNRDLAPGEEAGMSLRDYFAGLAMAAQITQSYLGQPLYDVNDPEQARTLSYLSYQAADAMIAERAK